MNKQDIPDAFGPLKRALDEVTEDICPYCIDRTNMPDPLTWCYEDAAFVETWIEWRGNGYSLVQVMFDANQPKGEEYRYEGSIPIDYCPVCGRRLEGEDGHGRGDD